MLGTGADGQIYDNSGFYDRKLDGIVLHDMTEADTDGYYCFRKDYHSNLTQYKTLTDFFGHARALHKGGMVDSNNTAFVGFGKAGGYPWFGFTTYDRDYNGGQLVESYGIMVRKGDVAGHSSAYIIDGGVSTDKETRLVTEDEMTGKANVGHGHAISEITNLQSTLNGKQATLVSGTNIKTINGNSILGSGNLSINASLPQNSDVILRTLSFKGGSNYSISGIYVIETDSVSLSGSVGSNASVNFSIDSYYYSDYPNGRWYYVATPTSGGYIDTIAVGVEATTSGGGGGKVWIRRVSSGSTQNYKVTVYCIRQY